MIDPALFRLLHLCDPALPVGGFAHSYGLETYVQQGRVRDEETARGFLQLQLSHNLRYTDAALVSLAYGAAESGDVDDLLHWNLLAQAVKMPVEIRLAGQKLGARLLQVFSHDEHPLPAQFCKELCAAGMTAQYPVVFGMLAQVLGLARGATLSGFYYNTAAGLITNCVKLVPLGQQSGQNLLRSLLPLLAKLAQDTMAPDPDLVGWCAPALEIRCMQHERLYSRLYMS
jgi:urease accessory protein